MHNMLKRLAFGIPAAAIFVFLGFGLVASATSTIVTNTVNLTNGSFPNAPIKASSNPTAIVKVIVTASQADQTLNAVTVNFSGAGFATTTLLDIATGGTSGVALFGDNGGVAGNFDQGDTVITLAANPAWTTGTANITLTPATPIALTSGVAKIFYVAFRTSASAPADEVIIATIPANGVVTSDGTGPASNYSANSFRVDTTAPTIVSVNGFAGQNYVTVTFSEPVQSITGGAIAANMFTFVDNGTTDTHSTTTVDHSPGQGYARVYLDGNLDSGDFADTASTLAPVAGRIVDMGGNLLAPDPVNFTSSISITTNFVPMATTSAVSSVASPLVTFAASGGAAPYTWSAADSATSDTLTSLHLVLGATGDDAGKLYGTAPLPSTTGNYFLNIKVADASDPVASTTRGYNLMIGTEGGQAPSIASVNPAGLTQGSTNISMTINGTYSSFGSGSTVQFVKADGTTDANIIAGALTAYSATSITFPVTVGAEATAGQRGVRVTTGAQVVYTQNKFEVFASGGGAVLTLMGPSSSATEVQMPPAFTFNPTAEATAKSYRIIVSPQSNFDAAPMWDYVFPTYAENPTGSHCTSSFCNVMFGEGRFNSIAQPTFLNANTTYYWMVKTYTQVYGSVTTATAPLETTPSRSFTTVSTMTDNIPPTITHRPVFQTTENAELNIIARVMDNFATANTAPQLTSSIVYCTTGGCTPSTSVAGYSIGAGYYRYTIPSASVGSADSVVRYWLVASDSTNSTSFKNTGDTPFQVTTVTAGASTITGNINDSSNADLAGAVVFAEGTGFVAATTTANGNFSLSGLRAGTYDLVVLAEGYGDRMMSGISAGASGLTANLSSGFMGGFGGDTARPRIKYSGPPDGSNAPSSDSSFKVYLVFDKSMSESSVTATGALTVNEVNPSTGELTNITTTKGAWTYYPSNPPAGVPSSETNVAVWAFSGSNTFGDNKTIAVKVLPSVVDQAGNQIQGNQSDGGYSFMFRTGSNATFSGGSVVGGTFGSGAFVAPFITGVSPASGSLNVPTNQKLTLSFSDSMADDGGGYVLANYVKLYTVSGTTETDVTSSAINTVTLDSSKKTATVALKAGYNSGAFAANTQYRVKVLGGAKAANNISMRAPGQESTEHYRSDFKTGTTADSGAPSVVGSYPDHQSTGVPVSLGAINLAFNKDLDASTITSSSVYLSIGSSVVNTNLEYRPLERTIYLMPSNALNSGVTYSVNVTTAVKGINGTALASNVVKTFSTGSADTGAPAISYINADDYNIAVTFSKPMNSAKVTDTLNWPTSVINPSVYNVIKAGATGDVASTGSTVSLTGATYKYDAPTNTVTISGVTLTSGHNVYLSMDIEGTPEVDASIAKDLSGNAITSGGNSAYAPVKSSSETKGSLGPMSQTTDSYSSGGSFTPTNFSGSTFGFAPPIEARPFNSLAGLTTIYGVRIPIATRILASSGGKIVLTFPTGFDISGAMQDVNSPMRSDLNGSGSGAIKFKCSSAGSVTNTMTSGKFCSGATADTDDEAGDTTTKGGLADDGVTVNTASRTVTVKISDDTASGGNDFLNLDIAGIKNSTVPKDYNTSGYTIDIKTMNGSTLLESLTSMPFYIQSAGSNTLTGSITAPSLAEAGTMKVYLNSPMTGSMEATTADFSDLADGATVASYSFANIPNGDYQIYTDGYVTIGSTNYIGKTSPERVVVSGNTTYDFSLTSEDDGTTVTVSIDGPNGELLDVFASSMNNFRVKQITLDGSAGAENFTIKLPDGQWNVGVGPQMPKGPMSGPMPAPTYLPPKPVDVFVTAGAAQPVKEASGTANDGTLSFTLTSANRTIKGIVKDGSENGGKIIANAEVYAYSPQGGMGTNARTDTNGQFSLGVIDGSYIVGAFVPGMPNSRETPVVVNSDTSKGGHATNYLFVNGSATGIAPATALTGFVLKVAKPDYTLSGKVTDGTNTISGASVYAYRTDGPGHANANTDSSGNYTLYVSNGSWKLGAFIPQYGNITEQTITVSGASLTNQNLSPTANGTYYAVSGTVKYSPSDTAIQGAFVRVTGAGSFNEAITGSDGAYSFNLPAGTGYMMRAYVPGVGELPPLSPFDVVASAVTGKNFTVTAPQTISIVSSTSTTLFIDLISSDGMASHAEINNATSTSLSIPIGAYNVRAFVPGAQIGLTDVAGVGETSYNGTTGVLTVDGAETIIVNLPTLRTVTGTVTDGTNNLSDAWVEIVNTNNGVHFGTQTSASGTYSLSVADSATSYYINAMKPGYFREPSAVTVNGSNLTDQTLTLGTASLSISGQVLVGATGASNAFVRAEKQGGGFTGTKADSNGNYTLYVSAGTWRIYGVAEGYQETAYASNPIVISSGALTDKDITISSSATVSLNPPKSKPITPSSGGTLEDTTSGIKMTIPANALGSSSSAGNIQAKETNNVRETASAKPVGGKAKEITATDSSGSAITNLNDSVTIEMSYSKTELATTESATDTSIDTKAEADKLQMAYWDETTSNWVTLPSTVTYYDVSGAVIDGATWANVSTTTIKANTTHFSVYAPISPTNPSAPSTPSGLAASSASASQINLTWDVTSGATSYDIYRSTTSDGTYSRLGSEPTVSSGSTASYSDTGLSASTAYYYKITALNSNGESSASSAVTATTGAAPAASSAGSSSSGAPAGLIGTVNTQQTATTTPATTTQAIIPSASIKPAEAGAATKAQPSLRASAVSAVFSRAFAPNQVHADVKRLQILLNSDPETSVAKAGAGSPGKETTKFGPATLSALKKFQVKYGITAPGKLGYGVFGPATRAKMAEVFGQQTETVLPPTSAQTVIKPKMTNEERLALIIKLLEQIKLLRAELAKLK